MEKPYIIEEADSRKIVDLGIGNVDRADVIVNDKVLKGLKEVANEYEKDLRARARAYAEQAVTGHFDTDEELLSEARSALDALYGEKRQKAEDRLIKQGDSLEDDRFVLTNDRTRALARVAAEYEGKQDRLAEKMSKHGLTHSSVAPLAEESLLNEEARAVDDVNYRYDKRIAAVDAKITRLNESYEQALKNYELSYAVQLEKDLARLKSKRDRLADEYEKQHASEKRQAYYAYLDEQNQKDLEYEEQEGDYTGLKKENYQARYDYLLSALQGKNKPRIRRFLSETEPELREYLGLYYDRFVKEVS